MFLTAFLFVFTQVCRDISQIKICMETGRIVILLNLENLYESLYDLLNQVKVIIYSLYRRDVISWRQSNAIYLHIYIAMQGDSKPV